MSAPRHRDRERSSTTDAAGVQESHLPTSHAQEAQDALAALEHEYATLVHVVSHDLRAPVRAVTGFSQLLAEELGTQASEEATCYLEHLYESGVRMQAMLEDLTTLSRVRSRAQPMRRCSLQHMFEDAVSQQRAVPDARDASISIGTLPDVLADTEQLGLVCHHLLDNALKFSVDLPEIEVRARPLDGKVELSVRDHGIGIPEHQRGRVFEMFQRLNNREVYPGEGAGLTIVRHIVRRHGGEVWIESAEPNGTIIRLTLPAA